MLWGSLSVGCPSDSLASCLYYFCSLKFNGMVYFTLLINFCSRRTLPISAKSLRHFMKELNDVTVSTFRARYIVGSRFIVLLLSFPEYFVQLVYSCAHLFSDTGYLLSTAPTSLEPVRWTRGTVGGARSYELRTACTSFYRRDTRSTTS